MDLPINVISFLSIDPPPSFDLLPTFSPSAASNPAPEIVPPVSRHLDGTYRTAIGEFPERKKAVSFSEVVLEGTDTRRPVLRSHQSQANLRGHICDSAYLDQTSSEAAYQPAVELISDFRPQLYRREAHSEGPESTVHTLLGPDYPITEPEFQLLSNGPSRRLSGLGYHSQGGDQYTFNSNGSNLAVTYDSAESDEEKRDYQEGPGEYASDLDDDTTALHQTSEYAGDSDYEVEYVIGSCQVEEENSIRFKDHCPAPDGLAHADRREVRYRTQFSSPDRAILPAHRSIKIIPSSTTQNRLPKITRPLPLKTDAQLDRTGPQSQSPAVSRPLTRLLPHQQSDSLPEAYRTELNLTRSKEQSKPQHIRRNLVSRRAKSMLDLRSLVDPTESTLDPTPQLSMYPSAGTHLEPSGFSLNDSFSNTTVPSSDGLPDHSISFSPSKDRATQLSYLQVTRRLVPEKGGIPSTSIEPRLAIASSASEIISPSLYSSSASSPSIAAAPMSNAEKLSLPKTGVTSVKARIALLEKKTRALSIMSSVPMTSTDQSSAIQNPKSPAPSVSTHRGSSLFLNGQVRPPTVDGLLHVSADDEKESAHNRHSTESMAPRGNLSKVNHTMAIEAPDTCDVDRSGNGNRNNGNMAGLGLVPINNQKHRQRPLPAVHRV